MLDELTAVMLCSKLLLLSLHMVIKRFFFLDVSDLSLVISESGLKAQPLTADGFAFVWTGAKATYGVKSDKVCFETKVVSTLSQLKICC
jgi:hypothetical protein